MQIHKTPQISIFFGDQATSFVPQEFYGVADEAEIRNSEQFRAVSEQLGLAHCAVIKQVHGVDGLVITKEQELPAKPYAVEGDYLITSVPQVGLAVATADCLPIIIYDPVQRVVAALHAGWRGTVAGIAPKVVDQLCEQFGSEPADLQIFFGPSAGPCCYEVDAQFVQDLPERLGSIAMRDGRSFFDTLHYNRELLQRAGVQNFLTDYWQCTICSDQFCSYRRDGKASRRQMTIVTLNSI